MTLTEYQTYLHSLYQGDGSTPSDGTDEWNHRENILAAAVGLWDDEPVLWNELWTTLTDAADGDKTVVAATLDYDMPTDFRFLGSFVRTTDSSGNHTYWEVLKPETSELYKNTSAKGVYVTGNKSAGFDLHFMQQPNAGDTINYPYYKEPSSPTLAAGVIEMSDPWFAVYYALSKLHEHDGDGDRALMAFQVATAKLGKMKTRNMMLPSMQPNSAPDRDWGLGYGGFGTIGSSGLSRYGDSL